jgi:hypothetical protein
MTDPTEAWERVGKLARAVPDFSAYNIKNSVCSRQGYHQTAAWTESA